MFKSVLESLDRSEQDGLSERINKEPYTKKYWITLGGSVLLLVASIGINIISMNSKKTDLAATFSYVVKDSVIDVKSEKLLITLPYAHQSFKNVSSWIIDAIGETFSFGFANFNEQIDKSQYYFTTDGYKTYLNALKRSGVEESIKKNKLEVSILALQDPVMINGGKSGGTEFWRFRLPVLVSFSGGKEAVIEKYMMELLVLSVPSYQNHKGLAIAEYNMSPI